MGAFTPEQVNQAFDMTCPELKSKYARYPMKRHRWLGFDETIDGQPTFIPSKQNEGLKEHYVFCKRGPKGVGYYHLLTKVSHVNLYSRIVSEGAGAGCCGGDPKAVDAHDTTRRVVWARTKVSYPDDIAAQEQQIQHMEGTKLNPTYGLKA